jgi:hypothetical protein
MTLADFRLPRFMRRMLAPLARVVCTDEAAPLTDAMLEHVELTMRAFPTFLRIGMIVGAFVFEYGALRPFSSRPRASQEAYFRAWWTSRFAVLRQLAKGLKSVLALAYWEQPSVKARLQYHPEQWIAEVAARRLRDYGADIAAHDRFVVAPNPLVQINRRAEGEARRGTKVKRAS